MVKLELPAGDSRAISETFRTPFDGFTNFVKIDMT